MAYLKPPWFTQRVFNPLAMKFGIGGAVALAVAGRKTGQQRMVPVIPVECNGVRYLVCPRGETEWVRNLRAASAGELRRKGTTERLTATEVPVDERPPILEAYRRVAGRVVESQFKTLPDPADHPVFRIEPRTT